MKAHEDEAAEQQRLDRHGKLVAIAWEHVVAAHDRFGDDTADKNGQWAYNESNLVLAWLREYRSLIE